MPREDFDLRQFLYLMDETTEFDEMVRILSLEILKENANAALLGRLEATAKGLKPSIYRLDDNISILELFHGSTSAFQDFSMSFLADLMRECRAPGQKVRLLMATSGDTGAAAAHAFSGIDGFDIIMLCPADRLPKLEGKYLAKNGGNTRVLSVRGNYQDCLALSNKTLSDQETAKEFGLAAATTLNPGRMIYQIFPYIFGFTRMKRQAGDFLFAVPAGNYGNFTSGLLAWKWGLPASGFITATGASSVLENFNHPEREGKPRHASLFEYLGSRQARHHETKDFSEIVNPENYERINALAAGNPMVLRSIIHAEDLSEREIFDAMRYAYNELGVFLDPHTASAFAAAKKMQGNDLEENGRIVIMATASPAKYADIVEKAVGKRPAAEGELAAEVAAATAIPDAEIQPRGEDLINYLKSL
jgi:threonine synthase